jgi:hypothetical protein
MGAQMFGLLGIHHQWHLQQKGTGLAAFHARLPPFLLP